MAKRVKERAKAEIETGSFSDISFLLIIFFVLTTTFVKTTGRQVDIPSATPPEEAKSEAADKTPSIHLFADRIMFARGSAEGDGRELTLPELKGELLKEAFASKSEKERVVIVECADEVTYERYFQIVTTVAETGGVVALVEGES